MKIAEVLASSGSQPPKVRCLFSYMDIQKYKDNQKTAFLSNELERLLAEEKEIQERASGELGELAADDLKRVAQQRKTS